MGESWRTHAVHQKGFDSFSTSDYVEGADVFIGALRDAGHAVTYLPAHEISAKFPADSLQSFDVVVISDVGANTFLLPPETFVHSRSAPDKTEQLRDYVEGGGSLVMVGGYMTFSGIDAKARWSHTRLAEALPVQILERDDRIELPHGVTPSVVAAHPVIEGIDTPWPALLGLNETVAKPDAVTVLECGGHPLLVVGEYGRGRTAAFTSDLAPHWAPPEFLAWPGYPTLWNGLIEWLTSARLARR